MTTQQLIERLKTFDPEMTVCICYADTSFQLPLTEVRTDVSDGGCEMIVSLCANYP